MGTVGEDRKTTPHQSVMSASSVLLAPVEVGNDSVPLYLRATVDPEAHLTLEALLDRNPSPTSVLVDSGATGVFMHPDFARARHLPTRLKAVPREVRVIDGRTISSGLITHEVVTTIVIGQHSETLSFDLTNTGRYSCILGTPWLVKHDPGIGWSAHNVSFRSDYCRQNCMQQTPTDRSVSIETEDEDMAWLRSKNTLTTDQPWLLESTVEGEDEEGGVGGHR